MATLATHAPAQPDPDSQVSPVLGYTTKGTPGQALLASCSAPVIMLGAEQLNPTAITFPSLKKKVVKSRF